MTDFKSNALIKLLKTLSKDEWKGFEKFVASPFHNNGRNFIRIVKALKKYHPEFNSPGLTKKSLYEKLYGRGEYKESVLNSHLSRLYSIGEEYLLFAEFNKNDYMYRESLKLKALSERGLFTKALKHIRNSRRLIERMEISENYFQRIAVLRKEESIFLHASNRRNLLYEPVSESINYMTYAFIVEVLSYDSTMQAQKNFWSVDYNKSFSRQLLNLIDFESMLELIKLKDKNSYDLLNIFFLTNRSINNLENDNYYFDLKDQVYMILNNLELNFRKGVLGFLSLVCTMKFVSGKRDFAAEGFEIRKKVIEENLYPVTSSNYMRISEFRSTLLEAVNLGEIGWAETFAGIFVRKIQPDLRDDITNYSKAIIAYERKDFAKAVDHAVKVNINQITFKLDMKNFIAKTYFETKSFEPLISHLNSYYQLVKTSGSMHHGLINRHLNLIKYLRKIVNIVLTNKRKEDLPLLKNKIESENVTAKKWLLEKIRDLT